MAVTVILIFGCDLLAYIRRVGAACMETAALGRICRRGDIALEYYTVHFYLGIGMRDRREQCLGVRMKRIGEYLFLATILNH